MADGHGREVDTHELTAALGEHAAEDPSAKPISSARRTRPVSDRFERHGVLPSLTRVGLDGRDVCRRIPVVPVGRVVGEEPAPQ